MRALLLAPKNLALEASIAGGFRLAFRFCYSLLAFCLMLPFASSASAESSFPYLAEVTAGEAPLRCGPGKDCYATRLLAAGEQVEIFRREPDGWLAVRPPESSFSWVVAADVQPTDDPAVVEVVGRRAVSWIGTELPGANDHKWQVQLERGERLEVLGDEALTIYPGAEAEAFYKIAPPAGEFRWIHERLVRPVRQLARTEDPQTAAVQQAGFRFDDQADGSQRQSSDGFVPREPLEADAAQRVALLDRSGEPVNRRLLIADGDFDAQLRAADLRLALEVTRPPDSWDLDPLRQELDRLASRAESTLTRGRARRVLEKLEEYDELRRGYTLLQVSHESSAEVEEMPRAAAESLEAGDSSDSAAFDPRFDGRGWLLPVHSSKRLSPPYALLDSQGQILQFVSPAPGVNLHRYLRKEVGIFGQRSRTAYLDKPHLTAHRVIDVARHRR